MARKHNYLNNKDILTEIHTSKRTYCTYRNEELDHQFDLILDHIDDINGDGVSVASTVHPDAIWHTTITNKIKRTSKHGTKFVTKLTHGTYANKHGEHLSPKAELDSILSIVPNIQIAKDNKAKRIAKGAYDAAVFAGEKVKQAQFAIDPYSYTLQDLVFRINTFEHIPLAPPKPTKVKAKRKKIIESDLLHDVSDDGDLIETPPDKIKYVRVNFPPFFHYRFNEREQLFQVAQSHWVGEYNGEGFDGEFNIEHDDGHMTEKLAKMFRMLCERYATKANWRGYTYNDEMRGQAMLQLSVIGLQFNEMKSQNPFAYYTAAVNNAFCRVLNIEKRNQSIRDDILEMNDFTPSYSRQNEHDMARAGNLPQSNHGDVISIDPATGERKVLTAMDVEDIKFEATGKRPVIKKPKAKKKIVAKPKFPRTTLA